tara:strand:+ start:8540 stop:9697 length:1158 start_codon:yes stop_codon:yes gene_type:complete
MASIGENAYGGTLVVDTLKYTTLDPALTGFVHNPMNSDLDGDNRNINNLNSLTATQLNYTTLNPPINPGVTNPLGSDLLCAGKNIGVGAPADKANEIKGVTGTFDNSAIGVSTGTTLGLSGALTAVGSTYGSLGNIVDGLTVGNGLTVSTGDIKTDVGDIIATGSLTAIVGACTAAEIIAGNDVTAQTGDIVATAGKVQSGANMYAGTHIVADQYIRSDNGNILTATGNIYTQGGKIYTEGSGDIYTDGTGNIDCKVGIVSGQRLKMNNWIDGGTTYLAPVLPTVTFIPDMTGKTKACIWIYDPANTVIQFFVQTGILDVCRNASTFLTMNQYSTVNPKRIINYRIGQKDIAGNPDSSILVVSVQLDGVVPSSAPVRICLMVIPD